MSPSLKDIRKKRQRIIFHEGSQEKISLEEIISFEEKHNIKIPEQYKDFLLKYNGVGVTEGYFISPDNDNGLVCIDDFVNLEWSEVGNSDEQITDEGVWVLPPKGLMNIALTSLGQSEIFIGVYKGESYGKIYYNPDGRDLDYMYLLANSFDEFLNNSIPEYENYFHQYCMQGEIEKAIKLINNGFKCDYMVYFALEGAFNHGSTNNKDFLKLIEILIDKGADLSGMLAYSAFINATEIVKLIYKKGGNLDEINFYSTTALQEAFSNQNLDLTEFLIKCGANIKQETIYKPNIITSILHKSFSNSEKEKEFIEKVEKIIINEYKIKDLSEL